MHKIYSVVDNNLDMRFFCGIILSVFMFGGVVMQKDMALFGVQSQSIEYINVYNSGEMRKFSKEDSGFGAVMVAFYEMMDGHHEMPAFGVSIDKEVRVSMAEGVWIEFVFDSTYIHNDMPFERLLINVQEDFSGFNVVRFNNGKYEGRCFYVDLVDKKMNNLYRAIQNEIYNVNRS